MVASLPMEKSLVMMVSGRALFTHLITGCRLSSVIRPNQLQSVRSAKLKQIVFMIAQRCRATHLTYFVPSVLKI